MAERYSITVSSLSNLQHNWFNAQMVGYRAEGWIDLQISEKIFATVQTFDNSEDEVTLTDLMFLVKMSTSKTFN